MIRKEMGVVLPESIDPEQWMWARKQQYVLIAFLALCFLILCLVGIASWAAAHSNAPLVQSLREQIDAAESKLQKAIDREKQQLTVAAEVSGEARIIARYQPSPEIKELAEKLKVLVAEFKTEVGTEALSEADNRRIRLAEGMVANVEGAIRKH